MNLKLRIVYYSRPCFFDSFLPRIRALSTLVELHPIIELSPEGWNSSFFDLPQKKVEKVILNAKEFLADYFPNAIQKYWQNCISFTMVVHSHAKSLHPKSWEVSYYAIKQILKINPDILHLDDVSLRFAPLLWKIKKIPVILTIHDPRPHLGEENWRTTIARMFTFNKTRHFILHSQFSRNQFLAIFPKKAQMVSAIPLGALHIYRELSKALIQEQSFPCVLFLGRISPYKGVEVFIKAAEIASQKIARCTFLIAGKPLQGYKISPLPSLENQCSVQIHAKYLTNTEVAEFIRQSWLVVCPYLDATQSGVVLTAYAFGKPVVATRVGGLPEYVYHGKTGLLIPPGDPHALAEAIIDLLQNPEKRYQMKKTIQQLARTDLSWSRIAEQTVEVYEKALRRDGC